MNKANPPKPANNRTNLGVLTLLSAMLLLGVLGSILQAGAGHALQYGMALGFSIASALGLVTFAFLLIGKKRRQYEATA